MEDPYTRAMGVHFGTRLSVQLEPWQSDGARVYTVNYVVLGGLKETCVARASYMSHDVREKGGFGGVFFFFLIAHRFGQCRRGQAGKGGIFRGEDLGGRSEHPYTTKPVRCSHVARRFLLPLGPCDALPLNGSCFPAVGLV